MADVHVIAAPDKFRGTATAAQVGAAISRAALDTGHSCDVVPMADGGEGTLEALGGPNRSTVVTGPLGEPVEAQWRLSKGRAVIEMARASGLLLAGGREGNDPMQATTFGTGELISAALDVGAKRIVVGVGGSATTDGGLGALQALFPPQRLRGVELIVACDVRTRFVEAAERFGPQKGATPAQVKLLRRRLERLVQTYELDYGFDVATLEGAGAAGGLAGGLAALGARIESGFAVVADEVQLADRMECSSLVVTGEGFLDAESFQGKVLGGVCDMASDNDVAVLAVAGEVFDGMERHVQTISLVERFGRTRAMIDTETCITEVVADHLRNLV